MGKYDRVNLGYASLINIYGLTDRSLLSGKVNCDNCMACLLNLGSIKCSNGLMAFWKKKKTRYNNRLNQKTHKRQSVCCIQRSNNCLNWLTEVRHPSLYTQSLRKANTKHKKVRKGATLGAVKAGLRDKGETAKEAETSRR